MMFIRSTLEGKPTAVYAIWVLLLVMMGMTLVAAPFRLRELSQPCVDARCLEDHVLPTPEVIRVLENIGFTIRDYANYQIAVGFLQVIISWLLAVILLMRGDPGRMTLVVA